MPGAPKDYQRRRIYGNRRWSGCHCGHPANSVKAALLLYQSAANTVQFCSLLSLLFVVVDGAVVGVVVVQVFRNENVNFSGEYRVCDSVPWQCVTFI